MRLADRLLSLLPRRCRRQMPADFSVDWSPILARTEYQRLFATYVGGGGYRFPAPDGPVHAYCLGEVTRMDVGERRDFALFVIYQMARERPRSDPRFYLVAHHLLAQVFALRPWEEERGLLCLGRALLHFVPYAYPHTIYWPVGDYLGQVARSGRVATGAASLALYREWLAVLAPGEWVGYGRDLTVWRGLLEDLLDSPPPDRPRLSVLRAA